MSEVFLNNSIVLSFEEIDFYDDFKSSKFLENIYEVI
jgi:hypothetical protein